MKRSYYSNEIQQIQDEKTEAILGEILLTSEFSVEKNQRDAWLHQIQALKEQLGEISGSIYFEFAIPRMGKRADVVLLVGSAVFVIEYKVGENTISRSALEQVMDYSLDIKNFHETSHQVAVVPILVATEAESRSFEIKKIRRYENLFAPMSSNGENLTEIITSVNQKLSDEYDLNREDWEGGTWQIFQEEMQVAKTCIAQRRRSHKLLKMLKRTQLRRFVS